MSRHRIAMDRPGPDTYVAVPRSLVQRFWRFLFTYHRPAGPTRLAPTLASLDEGGHLIPTLAVSLADLRRARPL